jgi:ribonucleoside-diphosphate reductase alpha chain
MNKLELDVTDVFKPVRPVDSVAENILRKRYYKEGETSYSDVVDRVIEHVLIDCQDDLQKHLTYKMLLNRYFVPNSPCLVNAGTKNGGLLACFVVDFNDSIEEIYKTKLDFALIAKKGGGCGTTLSKIRPENSIVNGSAHGYAGGPIKFFDTICYDMQAITQSGFRSMAMMG